MADYRDVMQARESALRQNENLAKLAEKTHGNDLVLAITIAASAICLQLRSLECTLDYLDGQKSL